MLPYLKIFGTQIPMYGLCMSFAMLLAVLLCCIRVYKRGGDVDRFMTVALAAVIMGIIGAKALYFVVTYSWEQLVELVHSNGVIALLEGGLVFYGGLIGGIFGAFIGSLIVRVPLWEYSDPVVPVLPLAHAIGRMGCFCAGCCYGRVTDSWIGIEFPSAATGLAEGVKVIPTQLIEAGVNLAIFVFLMLFTIKRRRRFTTLWVYLICYGVMRFFIEFLRGDEIRGIFGAFSTSQWISIGLVALGVIGLIVNAAAAKRTSQKETALKEAAQTEAPSGE
ncbi:MAG: prolipoprotein diacylglyceryl transferase [Clostridia bacterium]|nr:prolipoprotein diacylglyceryl transferase [Clostridia bacterium]